MFSCIASALGMTIFGVVFAWAEPTSPKVENPAKPGLEQVFLDAVNALHIIFDSITTLSGGAERGALWRYDITTHARARIGSADVFAWPVQGAEGQIILALRGNQVVRVGVADGHEARFGPEVPWRKLLGVTSDGTVIGIVEQAHIPRPALMQSDGTLSVLPAGNTAEDEKHVALLLQEDRVYTENRRLVLARSERGGRGFDVYYVTDRERLNVSDCGDDACGQPALSLDDRHILYIRSKN